MSQLSLDGDSLVGMAWDHPEHGHCVVESVVGDRARIQVDGPRSFWMLWPVSLVRLEMEAHQPEPGDVWLSDGQGSFFNVTEHRRLTALGLVPLRGIAGNAVEAASPGSSGIARALTRRSTMPAATAKKPAAKKSTGLAGLSKAKLREKLLSTPTIGDASWVAAYGSPQREKGESRSDFIRRILK